MGNIFDVSVPQVFDEAVELAQTCRERIMWHIVFEVPQKARSGMNNGAKSGYPGASNHGGNRDSVPPALQERDQERIAVHQTGVPEPPVMEESGKYV